MRRQRHDQQSFGFDDFLQLVGSDPNDSPDGFGLRVPALAGVRYAFLLATCDLLAGDIIRGVRQYASLGFAQPTGGEEQTTAPFYPWELPIRTPGWRPVDGAIFWVLTLQNISGQAIQQGLNDLESFQFLDSMQPALLYQTAHFPALPLAPGYLGLDGYTPPAMLGTATDVVYRSIEYPWDDPTCDTALNIPVTASVRARFYAFVQQTNPSTRVPVPANTPPPGGEFPFLNPEDQFLLQFSLAQYWRVAGALKVDRARRVRDTEAAAVANREKVGP